MIWITDKESRALVQIWEMFGDDEKKHYDEILFELDPGLDSAQAGNSPEIKRLLEQHIWQSFRTLKSLVSAIKKKGQVRRHKPK